ncbi:unnamed protein product [Rotaria sordida]|uniref:PIPK domain-containing protein n=1 Tax=Rotaria sordida TaxID=392033 RepID=A0A814HFC5_9BILA|nr:unnamed protein product [Rotaria sordida]CAF1310782.1 unnamed protein product [Rotaria sordida]
MMTTNSEISEGVLNIDVLNRLDFHAASFVKAPITLRYVSSKTSAIGPALCHGIIDLLDHVTKRFHEYKEDDTTSFGNENHLYHSCQYTLNVKEDNIQFAELTNNDDKINIEISSLAPTMFYQLREDIGISNEKFRQSFSEYNLKDFTNTGRSGSLMYKTYDQLFILKTLLDYEARLLLQILSGYHLRFRQYLTLLNRYVGLYSLRIQTSSSNIIIYVAITINAFTPSLKINEIFDLKGSTIRRKITGYLSTEKFYKLKDMNFTELYPDGIRIPTNIYQKLKIIITNDAKALKKLNIMDYSLLLGIRHLDMSESQMLERQKVQGITALLRATNSFTPNQIENSTPITSSSIFELDTTSLPNSYLKPLEILKEKINMNLYYNDDSIAYATLPIPGIINGTNKRVYIYLALIDILQTYDTLRILDHTFRKLTDSDRHLEHSLIPPNEYEQRFHQFLFKDVFIDANDDFPWDITDVSKCVADIKDEIMDNNKIKQDKTYN